MTSVDTYKYMRLEEPTKTQKNIILTTSAFTWTALHGMLVFSPSSQHHLCTLSNNSSNVKFISCFGSRSHSTASHVSWQKQPFPLCFVLHLVFLEHQALTSIMVGTSMAAQLPWAALRRLSAHAVVDAMTDMLWPLKILSAAVAQPLWDTLVSPNRQVY